MNRLYHKHIKRITISHCQDSFILHICCMAFREKYLVSSTQIWNALASISIQKNYVIAMIGWFFWYLSVNWLEWPQKSFCTSLLILQRYVGEYHLLSEITVFSKFFEATKTSGLWNDLLAIAEFIIWAETRFNASICVLNLAQPIFDLWLF